MSNNVINITEYQRLSGRTAVDKPLHKDIFDGDDTKILHQAMGVVHAGYEADTQKRALFYNEPKEKLQGRVDDATAKMKAMYEAINTGIATIPDDKIQLLHGALGIASEAGEIMEEILKSILENRPVKATGLASITEEGGDVMWYLALLFRQINTDFETVGAVNLRKLAKRYPDQFTNEHALNRDLDAEKGALQS